MIQFSLDCVALKLTYMAMSLLLVCDQNQVWVSKTENKVQFRYLSISAETIFSESNLKFNFLSNRKNYWSISLENISEEIRDLTAYYLTVKFTLRT